MSLIFQNKDFNVEQIVRVLRHLFYFVCEEWHEIIELWSIRNNCNDASSNGGGCCQAVKRLAYGGGWIRFCSAFDQFKFNAVL